MQANSNPTTSEALPPNLVDSENPYEDSHEPTDSVTRKIICSEEGEPQHGDEDHHGYDDYSDRPQ